VNLGRAREIARLALRNLEASRQRIDDLNVYPVPDGDTGTNLTLTVRAIVEALEKSHAEGAEAVAKELSRAALMGARGNSGVIFSQIVRGFADVLGERDPIDDPMIARAFRSASDAAYRAVRRPVEGTMLTVIREMAEAAESSEAQGLERAPLLGLIVERGEESLARTPDLLAVLKEAGVVDAGAAGLVEIIKGVRAAVTGEDVPEVPAEAALPSVDAIHQELSRFRYCTVFVVEGDGLDADALERELERLGDSLLVVGDATALKVHVHTDEPGAALSLGTARGTLEGIEIANMHRQTLEREERLTEALDALPTLETGVVAVAPGAGNRRLFESLGATRVIEGGQTMNPSTEEIVAAVDATPATAVIVLPNNSNVILTAEQAAGLANKPLRVLPTRSVQAGLSTMISYDAARDVAENEAAMGEVLDHVVTGEVTVASRDVTLDGIEVRKGAWLGLADGEAVASGDSFDAVAGAVVERLLADGRETLMLLKGADEPQLGELVSELRARYPGVEIEVHEGGQPHYPLLLSAE
jgi:fatty acid kinase